PSFAAYAREYVRTQWPKEQAKRGRFRAAGLAPPSHPHYPYADEAWQYPGWEERLRTIRRGKAKERAEEGRYREVGLAPPRQPPPEGQVGTRKPIKAIFEELFFNPFTPMTRGRSLVHATPERLAPITGVMERARGLTLTARQFPYLLGERGETRDPVREDERARMLREYPWSDYGKAVIGRTVMGRMTPIEGRLLKAGGYATALPGGVGIVRLGGGGEAVPHEIAHLAQFVFPFWSEIKDEFPQALREWLGSEPTEEWDEQKRYLFNAWVRREAKATTLERLGQHLPGRPDLGDMEVYAHMAQTPWLIPPELERFFPQYDLRSRGHTAREGFRGPTYPSFWPPPAPAGPRIR
ncbi:MAG: hypothetical protein GTO63_27705, partial [Anaerolineae bacterium]|nr:hypothetical protein [Anaerolineae bacterium]NIO00393.1 hypothetical protein [Anaerolineae bacterium]NIQ83163.1 hypothetical protein [Anaerolineae bacterium]